MAKRQRRNSGIGPGDLEDEPGIALEIPVPDSEPPKEEGGRNFTLDSEGDYQGSAPPLETKLTFEDHERSGIPLVNEAAVKESFALQQQQVAKVEAEVRLAGMPLIIALPVPMTDRKYEGRLPNKVQVSLDREQQVMLDRIYDALHAGAYRRANKQHIDKKIHVFQWILDELVKADKLAKAVAWTAEQSTTP
jgi:hypothetical protein